MKTEPKTDKLTPSLRERLDAYHASLAYVRRYAAQIEDLRQRLDDINAALVENEQLRGRPPAKILLDMSLEDVKNLAGNYSQLEVERDLLQGKRDAVKGQLGNAERNHSTFKSAADDAKRDVWVGVYEDRLGVLKAQHGELLDDLLALTNHLQKMPHELSTDLLPEGEANLARIDRMATEFGGLPL